MVKIPRKISENNWNQLRNQLSDTYRCTTSAFYKRLIMKKTISINAQSVTFSFDGFAAVTLAMADVTPENARYAMLHGFAARIGDNAAIQKSVENNFTVTEFMRREAVLELVQHYTSGSVEWNTKVAERKPAQNPTILAIAAKMGLTYTEAEAEIQRRMLAELA